MSETAQITIGVTGAGQAISRTYTRTGSSVISVSESVPGASTDLEIECAFTAAALKAFYAVSPRAMTLETNDGAAPADTIAP